MSLDDTIHLTSAEKPAFLFGVVKVGLTCTTYMHGLISLIAAARVGRVEHRRDAAARAAGRRRRGADALGVETKKHNYADRGNYNV